MGGGKGGGLMLLLFRLHVMSYMDYIHIPCSKLAQVTSDALSLLARVLIRRVRVGS